MCHTILCIVISPADTVLKISNLDTRSWRIWCSGKMTDLYAIADTHESSGGSREPPTSPWILQGVRAQKIITWNEADSNISTKTSINRQFIAVYCYQDFMNKTSHTNCVWIYEYEKKYIFMSSVETQTNIEGTLPGRCSSSKMPVATSKIIRGVRTRKIVVKISQPWKLQILILVCS